MSEEALVPVLSGDKEHSPYGCSSHPQFAVCPGYMSGGGSNPMAEKGNDLHDIAAEALEAALAGVTSELAIVGDTLPCGQIYTQEDAFKVEAYIEHCLQLVKDHPECIHRFVEIPQPMSSIGLPDDVTTPDFLIVEPFGLCIVMDLKTGKTPVSATSEQLRSYGLERFDEYCCTEMICCVSQDSILKTKSYSELEINFYRGHITRMIEMAQWDAPPCIPGKACTYCVRDCAVRKGVVQQSTGSMLSVEVEELTPEQLAGFLDFDKILDAAVKRIGLIKARGHAFIEKGVPIPGWHLEPGKSFHVWRNENSAKEAILELFANHKKRETVNNPAANGGKRTKMVSAPIDAKEISVVTVKMRSPSAVYGLVGKSKAIVDVLEQHISKIPSSKQHLRRDINKLSNPEGR